MDDKSPVEKLRQRIEAEIARLPQNTSAAREAIYDKFRAVVTGNPKFTHLIGALESTITQIEQVEMVHSPEQPSQTSTTRPGAAEPTVRSKSVPLIAIALAVIVLAGAGWWYLGTKKPNPEFDRGAAGYAIDPENLKAASGNPQYVGKQDGQDYVLEVTGPSPIYAANAIAIDPAKTYRLTAKIRVLSDDPAMQGASTYVGVATYDSNGVLQTSAPGAHRYAATANRIIKSSDGWVEVQGEITGEGNETHNQFRPGTKSVRPMALLNYKSPGAVSQISYLRFEEVK